MLDIAAKVESSLKLINKSIVKDGTKPIRFIPTIPDSYCFYDENFLSDSFSVDGFVKRNSRRVKSLEKLKEDLTAYLKILKHSMVELINEDYTEFINLSSNLISFEKSIGNIQTPVSRFKEETVQVRCRLEEVIGLLNIKHGRLGQIRENKLKLNMIRETIQSLQVIEKNSSLVNSEPRGSTRVHLILDQNSVLISRLSVCFESLLDNLPEKNCSSLVVKLHDNFGSLSAKHFGLLEAETIHLLTTDLASIESDSELDSIVAQIKQLLRIYSLNDNQKALENIIKVNIVWPCYNQIVCEAFIGKAGVQAMFDGILSLIDTKCALLLKVLTEGEDCNQLSAFGFQLITATVWNEFVECSTVRAVSLFSLANGDTFQHNYSITFRFVEDFISKVGLTSHQKAFRQLNSYQLLKSKFNLNVYFHMKLQQIVPNVEKSFTEYRYSLANKSEFQLNITCVIYDYIYRCWHKDNGQWFIGDLFSYLWKLTLKILIRFAMWIGSASIRTITAYLQTMASISGTIDLDRHSIHQILGSLLQDSQTFVANFTRLYKNIIHPQWVQFRTRLDLANQIAPDALDGSFHEAISEFHSRADRKLFTLFKAEIISDCTKTLDFVNDIPRLYRRTNKEKPQKSSAYISKCVQELGDYLAIIGLNSQASSHEWIQEVLSDLCQHYKNSTLEVLTSVQKTEDSLKKLKKAKPNSGYFRNANSSMSDDDKIRLQIYLDVQELGKMVKLIN